MFANKGDYHRGRDQDKVTPPQDEPFSPNTDQHHSKLVPDFAVTESLKIIRLAIATEEIQNHFNGLNEARAKLILDIVRNCKAFFKQTTGSDEYFNKNVQFPLQWALDELGTNDLLHGVFQVSSPEKEVLSSYDAKIKVGNRELDSEQRRTQILNKMVEAIKSTPEGQEIHFAVAIYPLPNKELHLEIKVGAQRDFDLAKALNDIASKEKALDQLEAEKNFAKRDRLLEEPWGNGLKVLVNMFPPKDGCLSQEPPISGPIIARKTLPTYSASPASS